MDADSFLVSRAHVHSDPTCNRRDSSKIFAPRYVFTSCSSKSEQQFTTSREAPIFQFNLGTNYSRPLGLASNQGLPNRVCKNPNSEKFTESTSPVSGQEINSRQGSIRITGEACNSLGESTSSRGGFCKFPVCSPQERGRQPPGSQPETPKPLAYEHFKMEGIHMLKDLLKQGDWLVKIDLKDAYLTVPIWKNHQKYLRFVWKGSMLEFACLPFGLGTAPRVFTKLRKLVIALLRQRGFRLIIYLDDILLMAESHHLALFQAASTLNLLESLGFIVNYRKSHLDPVQQLEFLGVLVDTRDLSLYLPGEKLRQIRKKCQNIPHLSEISVRELTKFLGLLTSSIQAIFPAPLHFRHLQSLKNKTMAFCQSYEALTQLDQASKEEILWWRDHLQAWNGRALFQKPVELIIDTDASRKGWGAYCQGISTGGPWCLEEKKVTHQLPRTLSRFISHQDVHQGKGMCSCKVTDGQCCSGCIHQQDGRHSHSQVLSNLALDLWDWCIHHHMEVSAQHLPGHLNVRADRESRLLLDSSDWKLDPAVFQLILQRWGPLEIDLFASRLTYQLKQFVSWRPDPLAIHSDAFSMSWHNIQGSAFPPFALIGRCLQQIVRQNVEQLILVAPVWPSQPWYPLLLQLCIDHPLLFPMSPTLLTRDNQSHPFPTCNWLAGNYRQMLRNSKYFGINSKYFAGSLAKKHISLCICLE